MRAPYYACARHVHLDSRPEAALSGGGMRLRKHAIAILVVVAANAIIRLPSPAHVAKSELY